MTVEVHTENGIEGPTSDEWRPNPWPLRVAWLLLVAFLLGVVLTIMWIGSADASAAGGCGGG